jgi:uncharacterized protein involved in exopolysaccharide biosynthesis
MGDSTNWVKTLVNRQMALVRTLADEVHRYSAVDLRAVALREQLREEEARLAELLGDSAMA